MFPKPGKIQPGSRGGIHKPRYFEAFLRGDSPCPFFIVLDLDLGFEKHPTSPPTPVLAKAKAPAKASLSLSGRFARRLFCVSHRATLDHHRARSRKSARPASPQSQTHGAQTQKAPRLPRNRAVSSGP